MSTGCLRPENNSEEQVPQVRFEVPEGFILEKLYEPGKAAQGSWVSLARGPGTSLFAGDQFGAIYKLHLSQNEQKPSVKNVDSLPLNLGHAQGLLWFRDTLYISVNRSWEGLDATAQGSGIYRAWDGDGDGLPDTWDRIVRLQGHGEHGPHSLVLKPDASGFVLVAGNHTTLPEALTTNSRVPLHWGEDQLLQPYPDPRGHATDITAPGGWVAQYDFASGRLELLSTGYRNAFDLAFLAGELFTYDSDMEWDLGMPWYRPTRICHVTSGSEYGWRTGSGKWPEAYPDNLPGAVSMLQGSPTALLAGHQLRFPAEYRRGLFAADWSFGTLYYITLEPDGASFRGSREEFLSGTPLPLSDMVAGPGGDLYFVSGGRELQSALYRLRWNRPEIVAKDTSSTLGTTPEGRLRHQLEQFHSRPASEEEINFIWKNLSHPDRFVRFAARIALEHQSPDRWAKYLQKGARPDAVILAGIAASRMGDSSLLPDVQQAYLGLRWEQLTDRQRLDLIRGIALAWIRHPEAMDSFRDAWVAALGHRFPTSSRRLDMTLAELLVHLEAPGIVPAVLQKMETLPSTGTSPAADYLPREVLERSEQYGPSIAKMLAALPPGESLHYARILSRAQHGWNKDLRTRYYDMFFEWFAAEGGMSFKAYLDRMRTASLVGLPPEEVTYYEKRSGVYRPGHPPEDLPQPIGPGKAYTAEMLNPYIWGSALETYEASHQAGERAFKAAQCIVCHRINGMGGASGPDLSQIGSKFSRYDLVYSILSPNDQVSDQYANTLVTLEGGQLRTGRIKYEDDSLLVLMPNPFDLQQEVRVEKNEIVRRGLSPVSPMPPGLLNRLNEDELRELLVFLLANGDPDHPHYRKANSSE